MVVFEDIDFQRLPDGRSPSVGIALSARLVCRVMSEEMVWMGCLLYSRIGRYGKQTSSRKWSGGPFRTAKHSPLHPVLRSTLLIEKDR